MHDMSAVAEDQQDKSDEDDMSTEGEDQQDKSDEDHLITPLPFLE